jgi:AraC-like DNA-binding protein
VKLIIDFYGEVNYAPSLDQPVPREILPFPGAEMVAYIQGSATYVDGLKKEQLPSRFILGQPTMTRKYTIEPGSRIFIVRLRQHLLKYLLNDLSVWRDTVFDWTDKFPSITADVLQGIFSAGSLEERITLVDAALQPLIPQQFDPTLNWLHTIDHLHDEDFTVGSLAKRLNISTRQLERKFIQYFDLSPKQFLRLRKLSDALDHYARNAQSSITEASYEGRFTDQAHFIKTFRLYASKSPLKFFNSYGIKSG